ncbi:MAG: acetyl-CoA carboxylase biotin carboxyl carrier protein subunit [Eubacteriales bacterium]|nr:acetyl-CoA carboxylase biotin carboxyl carrier protein subunit [Eubacteriales bacterium]MDD4422437.1 acetyl-CoA carboxylase biotin carboxyl carrier protein subunit [Eubacteriales bacterium]
MKKYNVTVDGESFEVIIQETELGTSAAAQTSAPAPKAPDAVKTTPKSDTKPAAGGLKITAPLPGSILKVLAKPGQIFKQGQTLCVLEAMKMENEIVAPQDCTVVSVEVNEGASVNTGDLLFIMS